jgi:hypothetical protein
MPYIKQAVREQINRQIDELAGKVLTPGELNYVITRLCHQVILKKNETPDDPISVRRPPSYSDYNGIVGVLECAKLEFYRAAVTPYEELKFIENGPVSELDTP